VNPGMLYGPGYALALAPGFTIVESMPPMGIYRILPPGSFPYARAAQVQIRAVQQFELGQLLQNVYGADNPMVAQMNAVNLGMVNVTGMLPVRQVQLPQGLGHIREFEGLAIAGFPVRVMEIVIVGQQAAVELVIMMNLFRWMEFVGPCLSLITALTLAGAAPVPARLEALMDQNRRDQVEYQMVTPGQQPVPLTALPTSVQGVTVVNYGTIIETGNINGTGIAIGPHSVSKVETQEGTHG
jgi:hypothetical protein